MFWGQKKSPKTKLFFLFIWFFNFNEFHSFCFLVSFKFSQKEIIVMRPKLRRPEFEKMQPDLYKQLRATANTRKKMLVEQGRHISWVMPEWVDRRHLPAQEHIPAEKDLATKIGMKKGDKVVVFAGFLGDWAGGLSNQTRVTYTDINPKFKKFVKNQKRAVISRFKTIPGESVPQRMQIYDWSFSFEPIPLLMQGTLGVSLARSLMNNRGAKMIFGENYSIEASDSWTQYVKPLKEIYGAEIDFSLIDLNTHVTSPYFGVFPAEKRKFDLITIKTNPAARKKVFLDMRILNAVDKANFYQKRITTRQLAKRFGISQVEAIKSVMRLEKLLGQKQKGLLSWIIREW